MLCLALHQALAPVVRELYVGVLPGGRAEFVDRELRRTPGRGAGPALMGRLRGRRKPPGPAALHGRSGTRVTLPPFGGYSIRRAGRFPDCRDRSGKMAMERAAYLGLGSSRRNMTRIRTIRCSGVSERHFVRTMSFSLAWNSACRMHGVHVARCSARWAARSDSSSPSM